MVLLASCSGGGGGISAFWLDDGVAVADFNGDGLMDIAVAKTYVAGPPPHPGSVDIYLRTAGAGFGAPTAYAIGSDPWGLAVGDINGDLNPDLAVADSGSGTVSLLLREDSDPNRFKPARQVTVGGTPYAVAIDDLDGDGLVDLAVALQNTGGGAIVLFQDTDAPGAFLPGIPLPNGTGATAVAIGDLNHDGLADVAVNGGTLSVFLQQAGRSFTPAMQFPAGTRPTSVAVADVDLDGFDDLLATNGGSPGDGSGATLAVLYQDPGQPGDFFPADHYPVANGAQQLCAGPLGAGTAPDVAVISLVYAAQQSATVTVLKNQAGAFVASDQLAAPFSGNFIAMGDIDDDGLADLVVNDGPELFLQNPATPGTFIDGTPLP